MVPWWSFLCCSVAWYRQWRCQVIEQWWSRQSESPSLIPCPLKKKDECFALNASDENILDWVVQSKRYDVLEMLVKMGLSGLTAPQSLNSWEDHKRVLARPHDLNAHLAETPFVRAFKKNDVQALDLFMQDQSVNAKKFLKSASSVPFYANALLPPSRLDLLGWLLKHQVSLEVSEGEAWVSYCPLHISETNPSYPKKTNLLVLIGKLASEEDVEFVLDVAQNALNLRGKEQSVLSFCGSFHALVLNRWKTVQALIKKGFVNVNAPLYKIDSPQPTYLLSLASLHGTAEMVDVLLASGAQWEVEGRNLAEELRGVLRDPTIAPCAPQETASYALSCYEAFQTKQDLLGVVDVSNKPELHSSHSRRL